MNKLTIKDLDLKGKRLFIRVDFNVPLKDGKITDDTRIRETLPTLNVAIEAGGRLVLASHLGRPKGGPDPKYSLKPAAAKLQEILGKPVEFASDCVGPEAERVCHEHDSWHSGDAFGGVASRRRATVSRKESGPRHPHSRNRGQEGTPVLLADSCLAAR